MELKQFRSYCLKKPGVTEAFPFDEKTLTLKVASKLFALINIEKLSLKVNLKCDPIMAMDLRKDYHSVEPGYHMNHDHWNTITFNDDMEDEIILYLIDISYELVFKELSKLEKSKILEGK